MHCSDAIEKRAGKVRKANSSQQCDCKKNRESQKSRCITVMQLKKRAGNVRKASSLQQCDCKKNRESQKSRCIAVMQLKKGQGKSEKQIHHSNVIAKRTGKVRKADASQ